MEDAGAGALLTRLAAWRGGGKMAAPQREKCMKKFYTRGFSAQALTLS
jgi:hypothetical protein